LDEEIDSSEVIFGLFSTARRPLTFIVIIQETLEHALAELESFVTWRVFQILYPPAWTLECRWWQCRSLKFCWNTVKRSDNQSHSHVASICFSATNRNASSSHLRPCSVVTWEIHIPIPQNKTLCTSSKASPGHIGKTWRGCAASRIAAILHISWGNLKLGTQSHSLDLHKGGRGVETICQFGLSGLSWASGRW